MGFTTPLLGYNRGPGAQYAGIGGNFNFGIDPFALFNWASKPSYISEGEQVGYQDYDPWFPVGYERGSWLPVEPWTEGLWPPGTGPGVPEVGDRPVFETGSIYGPEGAVSPIDPSIYDIPYEDTGPGEAAPADPLEDNGGAEVAIDWGAAAVGAIAGALGVSTSVSLPSPSAFVGPTVAIPSAGGGFSGSCPPRKTRTLTIDCATGKEIKRTRRRRRRIMTDGDFNDLMRIATLPNKDTVKIALAKAIGR